MQLIYTDESGINYSIEEGQFKDGPFIFYGAICVDENKYFHLERLFVDLIKDSFSIEDWRSEEIHASNLWYRTGQFEKYSKEQITLFFEELLQLLTKLSIKTIVGLHLKTEKADKVTRALEEARAIYSFLHGIEFYLSQKSDTGLIIADRKQIVDSEKSIFSNSFYERTSWRTNPGKVHNPIVKSKFNYESRICFLLDNIHYVDSKESLFNQIIDIILYAIKRVWTYQSLRISNKSKPDLLQVPIGAETFQFFAKSILQTCRFDQTDNDVIFDDIIDAVDSIKKHKEEFLSDEYFKFFLNQ